MSFSDLFFHHCWDIVGNDVFYAVCYFFHSGQILPGLNSNFMVLIMKSSKAAKVNQFHPIV